MDGFNEPIETFGDSDEDLELLEAAMNNTYEYLISEIDIQDLPSGTWMLKQPGRVSTINEVIEYFQHADREEYEKCAELIKIKQTMN
jgi:hypothetical protein|tara:strand:+ start:497 stop:757 length:261 start_codon:yes stop_codon:yes gene_type:complete